MTPEERKAFRIAFAADALGWLVAAAAWGAALATFAWWMAP